MENALLKTEHKVVQEWVNAVLKPNHTVGLIPNNKVLQGCNNVVRTYGPTKPTTVPYTV